MPYPNSNIHPGAQIGANVEIGSYVTIEDDVVIGDGCILMPNAVVLAGTRLGKNCKIHHSAVVGGEPQDLKFEGEYSTLEIGDGTTIREFATINRGTNAAGTTVIGKNCLLMAYTHVAHDCIIGDNVVLANNVNIAGHVEIGDHAVLGGTAAVHQFVKIGKHVMLGGGSLLRKDVPPYITAARNPVKFMGLNRVGLTRRGFSIDQIKNIDEIYKLVFQSHLNKKEAIEVISSTFENSPEKEAIVNFFAQSERGIIRGPKEISNED